MNSTSVLLESRVDWLTVTATKPEKRGPFLDLASTILNTAIAPNVKQGAWQWKGYHGIHAGKLTFGRRDDSDIIQLSSDFAHEWLTDILPLADHCTRVDLCTTVKVEGAVSDLIGRHHDQANAYRVSNRPSLGINLILGNGEPQTLYIGSRTSDLFARIYDKGAESNHESYRSCLRYELEVKGDPAQRCFTHLAAATNRADWIRGAVHEHLNRRGIEPEFGGLDPAIRINSVRPVSDDATRLEWLASTVRPTVQRLLASNRPEKLLAALGFPRSSTELLRLGRLTEQDHHRDYLQEWDDEDTTNS